MKRITNVSFLTLEFDFSAEGAITSEVFLEIDNDGELTRLQHKAELQDVSFHDFLSTETINDFTAPTDNFSNYIQNLRKLITLKVASDLNLEVVDLDYVAVAPVRDKVETLEHEKDLLKAQNNALSERADFIEDVVAEMAAQVYQ